MKHIMDALGQWPNVQTGLLGALQGLDAAERVKLLRQLVHAAEEDCRTRISELREALNGHAE